MDTGADTLTMPHYMMYRLGLAESKLKLNKSQGIGKELIKVWESEISIHLGQNNFVVNCSFTDNDNTPFLLGKDGIFQRYNLKFDSDNQQTVFEKRLTSTT